MAAVSIILPVFNRTHLLRQSVDSVFRQTFTDWELIIADDGSEEPTQAYLRTLDSAAVRVMTLAHSGNPSKVRNHAIAAATGRYLAFLDSDDIWSSDKLARQVAALEQAPNCRWSYTACDQIDKSGRALVNDALTSVELAHGWIFAPLLGMTTFVAMPTVMATRDLVEEIGGFDEQQLFAEFHDFCLRLAQRSQVVLVNAPLCSVRAHDEHYSSDRLSAHLGWMRLYGKMRELTPDADLRALCVRMRALRSLNLARLQGSRGERAAALTTLRRALRFSWRYPRWWYGAMRALASFALPVARREH